MPEKEIKFSESEIDKKHQKALAMDKQAEEIVEKGEAKTLQEAIKKMEVEEMQEKMKVTIEKKLQELDAVGVVEPKEAEKLIWEKLYELYKENPEVAEASGNSPLELFVRYEETYALPLLGLRNFALKECEDDPLKRKFYETAFACLIDRHREGIAFLKEHGHTQQVWIDFSDEKLRELESICPDFKQENFPFLRYIGYKGGKQDVILSNTYREAGHVAGTETLVIAKLVTALEQRIKERAHYGDFLKRVEAIRTGMVKEVQSMAPELRPKRIAEPFLEVEKRFPELLEEFE